MAFKLESVKTEVVEIDIDELGIDTYNIRGGEWDRDEELINSIKYNGVIEPLIVRSADESTGVKYAIVSGSRRFNASIEAGLIKVPCIIRELDDIEASTLSISENKHRKDIPIWIYATKIGELFEMLEGNKERKGTINFLSERTGFSKISIEEYLSVFDLPEEIFILMKKPEERTEKETELFKRYHTEELTKTLSKNKAVLISRELKTFPIEKQIEVAKMIAIRSDTGARDLIRLVQTYPKEPMESILEKYWSIPKSAIWRFTFDSYIVSAIDDACIRKKIDRKALVINYIKDCLIRDGFL